MVRFISLHFCLLHVRSIAELFRASLTLRTTWGVRTRKFWNLGTQNPENLGTLEPWKPSFFRSWRQLGTLPRDVAILKPWRALEPFNYPGTLKSWGFETMEACNFGFLKHCNLATAPCDNCNLRTWERWNLGPPSTLEPCLAT